MRIGAGDEGSVRSEHVKLRELVRSATAGVPIVMQGVNRNFHGFSEAAIENGMSRAYAGIHFLRAISDGYQLGRGIGRRIENMLPPAGN